MRLFTITFITIFSIACSTAQDRKVGGPCEGCEALFEYGDQDLNPVDTLPGFDAAKDKFILSGKVYQADGKTPAKDVILYVYQTDQKGVYPTKGNETNWAKRHGYIRGWAKTNKTGQYTFYTFRPASYPNTTVAQHIHITLKEPGLTPYYIDSYHFTDDPNLSASERNHQKSRGGNGIVQPKKDGDIWVVKRDIILGKNIPNY